jgi:hypothetical protein
MSQITTYHPEDRGLDSKHFEIHMHSAANIPDFIPNLITSRNKIILHRIKKITLQSGICKRLEAQLPVNQFQK